MHGAPTHRVDWPLRRVSALMLSLLLVCASLFLSRLAVYGLQLPIDANEFNINAWEARNVPGKWLYTIGDLFRDEYSVEEQDADIARFFQLTREIDALERQASDAAQRGTAPDPTIEASINDKHAERDSLENRVEATIEGRIRRVLKDEGLGTDILFFNDVVWPPVDFEFTEPPRTLATSPREVIRLDGTSLLHEDLSLAEVEAIEEATEESEGVSALAFPLGGLGAYPTVVAYFRDYNSALQTIAHEWVHNYLFFHPLGIRYNANYDMRSINETVADLVGTEIGNEVARRWPVPEANAPAAPTTTPQQRANLGDTLRKLRGDVDCLLAQGKVTEAETLMEQRREELNAQGFNIRKINQAYFAFTNLYAGEAGNAGATNPIGPKVDELRKRSASLQDFVHAVARMTSPADLDRALASAGN